LTPSTGNELEGKDYKYLSIAQYEVCKDSNHLERFLQDIIDNGGEGIILRDPRSPFESGRSNAYLKHKVDKYFLAFKLINLPRNIGMPRQRLSRLSVL